MGYVLVISLPLLLLAIIGAIGCYLLGRSRGRYESQTMPQWYAPPAPPPHVAPYTGDKPPPV
ncbi:hypothetical protein AMTRI_Chr09g19010 [Amborella trichopoda]|uniref:uncharacterized protein LOC105421939 n=1 Tax=Amborella trichopoda TaxID=13333 RepID=UPI0005D3A9A3|nr:uncharacterized protein LOC105421939 [Amborella trichopoda]|eukprot:XP_011629394.1 uncharacterized protein LOC105421939 [Amborella trichopoda]